MHRQGRDCSKRHSPATIFETSMDISDEQYKALIDQVAAMEAMLSDLKTAVRALKPVDEAKGVMERMTKAKAAFQEAISRKSAPDLYDAWDPSGDVSDSSDLNAQFYESENAEIKAEQVPQKGKVKLRKSRKAAPEYD